MMQVIGYSPAGAARGATQFGFDTRAMRRYAQQPSWSAKAIGAVRMPGVATSVDACIESPRTPSAASERFMRRRGLAIMPTPSQFASVSVVSAHFAPIASAVNPADLIV
ncbi:MAG: hypothetical protein KDA33_03350, partial [Phycisphaerales bacterium]|nr:hypothetical protein [Phycisphaerales bacterium]